MKEKFSKLKQHKATANKIEFDKVLSNLLPRLKNYITHRIKIYETKGWLPVNFYKPADVLADVYLNAYKEFERIKDPGDLKVRLFSWADQIIGDFAAKENKIPKKQKLPVDKLVEEELKFLYENLTVDADGEILLVNDLKEEDIEYQQDDFKPKVYLFDFDSQDAFAKSLGLNVEDFENEKLRSIFGSIYSQLPETARRILDLNAVGELTYGEIGKIVGIDSGEVEKIIILIQNKLNTLR